jgi:hypothetical protein
MSRRHAVAILLATACEKPPSPSEQEAPAPAPAPPPECRRAPPGDQVAHWIAPDGCPIVVLATATTVRIESLALEPTMVAASGPVPECRVAACRYEGVSTELGPMLVATEPGPQSEVPTSVFLGVVAGDAIVFVDLWDGAGPSVEEDETLVGPTHALVPMRCGTELGMFARSRVPGTTQLAVPDTLAARQGLMKLGQGGGTIRASPPGSDVGCTPIAVPLP